MSKLRPHTRGVHTRTLHSKACEQPNDTVLLFLDTSTIATAWSGVPCLIQNMEEQETICTSVDVPESMHG